MIGTVIQNAPKWCRPFKKGDTVSEEIDRIIIGLHTCTCMCTSVMFSTRTFSSRASRLLRVDKKKRAVLANVVKILTDVHTLFQSFNSLLQTMASCMRVYYGTVIPKLNIVMYRLYLYNAYIHIFAHIQMHIYMYMYITMYQCIQKSTT